MTNQIFCQVYDNKIKATQYCRKTNKFSLKKKQQKTHEYVHIISQKIIQKSARMNAGF